VPENGIKLCINYYTKANGEGNECVQNLVRKALGQWPFRRRIILR
jgi:hypothetical protein